MEKHSSTLPKQAILTWATQLFDTPSSEASSSTVLSEYICLSQVLSHLSPIVTLPLWQKIIDHPLPVATKPVSLAIGGLLTFLPWPDQIAASQREWAQRLIDYHLQLAQQLNQDETGLLHWATPEGHSAHSPSHQAAWIWSTTEILQLAQVNAGDLPQWKDIYVYETDLQLWREAPGCYAPLHSTATFSESLLIDNTLALFAAIPNQERAEQVLQWVQRHAPIWQPQAECSPIWLESTAYLLYLAMESYEMAEEAEELKQYVHNHLAALPNDARGVCLRWLWED